LLDAGTACNHKLKKKEYFKARQDRHGESDEAKAALN
jgi:hypothetical protein